MKTKTYNVYTFAELSESAKQRAKDQFAESVGFNWGDDYLASLKALAEHFNGKLSDYQIDWFAGSYSSADFDMPEMGAAEIAAKLAALGSFDPETLKGHGDCKLTGFCGDEGAIDGFRKAYHGGERDLSKLMQAAFAEWLKEAQSDCEGQFTDETFGETADANDWTFTESGEID